jgi:hypothetical protein
MHFWHVFAGVMHGARLSRPPRVIGPSMSGRGVRVNEAPTRAVILLRSGTVDGAIGGVSRQIVAIFIIAKPRRGFAAPR